jgi:hypothetical protein
MSVENTLTSLFPGIKNSSVAIKASFFGDLISGQEKVGGDGGAITSYACCIFGMQCGHEQNMSWCLWIQIIECNNIMVSINNIGRDLTFNNFAEDAVGI